ncbi:MAG: C69 family dipeptidase [Bacteroidia bacterium]|nr:C69 family dipeptidase [Bacteroidia bacterium]
MKKSILISSSLFLFFCIPFIASSQYTTDIDPDVPGYGENCTTIMVGRLASTDGSVMTSHSCDGPYRTWLEIIPHKINEKGTMHPIYWGTLHTEASWDMTNVTKKGEIPEAE